MVALIAAAAHATNVSSTAATFTAVTDDGCKALDPVPDRFNALGVVECPAVPGYRLFIASSEARSWIDLERHDGLWSSEGVVVSGRDVNDLGYFPNVGNADVVEWRLLPTGTPTALIFRIVLQEPNSGAVTGAKVSRLVTLGLFPAGVCYLGLAATNDEARRLAAGGEEACRAPLDQRPPDSGRDRPR